MTDRTVELEAAVRSQDALINAAQGLLTRYLVSEIESPALVDHLLTLFDGPQQRETQRLVREALGEARRRGAGGGLALRRAAGLRVRNLNQFSQLRLE